MVDYENLPENIMNELKILTAHFSKDFSGNYLIYHTYRNSDPDEPHFDKVYALIHTDHRLIRGESRDELFERIHCEGKDLQAALEKSSIHSTIDHYFIMAYGYDDEVGHGFLIDAFRTR